MIKILDMGKIFDLHMKKLIVKLEKQGLKMHLSEDAKNYLVERGFDPLYGARPLRRMIENNLENKIAQEIIKKGKNKDSGLVNGKELNVYFLSDYDRITVEITD